MSSWAERVHRRAADLGNVVTSCGHPGSGTGTTYPYRLEKVKFGVPLEEVCKNNLNIPGPLLVLILKLNKESPNRRDVFRAPGHQGAMKKLIHFLQSGRLVNVDNYSVYTIASVLKKFLRKIPNGIFGLSGEKELFAIIELENELEQCDRLHRLLISLPIYTQHLLVLLFGTFRVIASNAAHAGTGMTSEALGVSVAPSFFQSCVSDGKTARMEDVLKFKVATKIMKHIIDKFATHDLFGRDNYEYYARVTGRILKVQDEWICSFQHPPPPREKLAQQKYALQHSLEAEKTWLQCQCERWGLLAQEESRSTPALLTSSSSALDNSVLSLGVTPEHSFIESCARLSVSLEGPGLFALSSSPIPKRNTHDMQQNDDDIDDDEENYADDDEDDFAAELEISNDDDIENKPKKQNIKMKKSRKSAVNEGAKAVVDYDDIDDNGDDDDIAIVKRRYRQNKKKMTTTTTQMRVQHQRRLRVGSKSLDERCNMGATSTPNEKSSGSVAKSKESNAHMIAAAVKTRNCSRCNRGIRHHSSSCSSTGGGAAGAAANGSGMTMEELRAVNRYAESTKSLSYLPQVRDEFLLASRISVHERQTARMRTRSEWFLGPKDGLALQLPNTCSNCCLAVTQQQQQQQQQYDDYQNQQRYLGGGSTRDMRPHCTDFGDDDEDDEVAGSAFYMYHKKRQHQLQQQPKQYLQPEHMDTDESFDYESHLHSTAMQRRAFLIPQQVADVEKSNNAFAAIGGNRRLFADTNSVGNIRLSNSAESVQCPPRRLIGVNVPRQYPLRSSLRRNREKQIGSNSSGGSNGNNAVSSVRNSIAECCNNIVAMQNNILTPTFPYEGGTTITFKAPRV
ncbi:uncharacterized protein LOC119667489 isoform X3 [Teleopsis dalmanni]|uniref:uncharacterized protein LOC119667489 isoform X3 n=1 Tax=Teleopsis dalmanni TaxID=139649 RepID=UPI0018CE8B95|nr:uncharacterized protein LOC119667489 isoform X3 [Teleopsis dalmanni]